MSALFDDEARKKFIIIHINSVCRKPWSEKDQKRGKKISVSWENRKLAFEVLPLYREKGWIMSHEVMLDKSGRTLNIIVKRPEKPPATVTT